MGSRLFFISHVEPRAGKSAAPGRHSNRGGLHRRATIAMNWLSICWERCCAVISTSFRSGPDVITIAATAQGEERPKGEAQEQR